MGWMQMIGVLFRSLLRCQVELAAENLALRQQLSILEQRLTRPHLRNRDRVLWVWLSGLWPGWRSVLVIVEPATRSWCWRCTELGQMGLSGRTTPRANSGLSAHSMDESARWRYVMLRPSRAFAFLDITRWLKPLQ